MENKEFRKQKNKKNPPKPIYFLNQTKLFSTLHSLNTNNCRMLVYLYAHLYSQETSNCRMQGDIERRRLATYEDKRSPKAINAISVLRHKCEQIIQPP